MEWAVFEELRSPASATLRLLLHVRCRCVDCVRSLGGVATITTRPSLTALCRVLVMLMFIFSHILTFVFVCLGFITACRNALFGLILIFFHPAVEDAKAYLEKQSKMRNGCRSNEPVEHVQIESVRRYYDAFVLATDKDVEYVVKIIENMELKGLSVSVWRQMASFRVSSDQTNIWTFLIFAGLPQRRFVSWNVRTPGDHRCDIAALRTSHRGIFAGVHKKSWASVLCDAGPSDRREEMQADRDSVPLRWHR